MLSPHCSPYQNVLGPAYDALASAVRIAHEAPLAAKGTMDVVHGRYVLTPLLVRIMKLPEKGTNLPVVLHVTNEPHTSPGARSTMMWRRQIGATVLDTRQFAREGRLVEQSGPGIVEFDLQADSGNLHYSSVGCRFMGVLLPRFLAPRVRAQVSANDSGWHVEVTVQWRGHLVCRYAGAMQSVQP